MADRFYGTVSLGGKLTKEQFDRCAELIDPCLEMDGELEDGEAHFQECTQEDFADLIAYCAEQKIALMLQWDAKYEYNAVCEYWLNGIYKQFDTDSNGRIVVALEDLHEQRNAMTINEFIASLELPEFPDFEIVELTSMRTVTVYFSDGDTITTDINGTNEEIAKHYLGQRFEAGSDTEHHVALCVRFHDIGESIGLRCRNIESGCIRMIRAARVEVTHVDDNQSFPWICLTVSDTEYSLDDVWVYNLNGEWIKGIGYPHCVAN